MSVVDVLARLKADTSQFTSAMEKAADSTNKVSVAANKTSGVLTNKLRLAFTVAATAAGAYALKLGRDSVQAAQQAAAAQNRLRKLLLNTNGATEAQIQILFQQGKALEALTGISKENITVVQSQLATFDLHGSTIATLTPAILDYVVAEKGAAASADEFRSMTNGLAQALNGQFASLTRTGFVLDAETKKMIKSGTESERAAGIVKVLETTYRDFAATAGGPAAIAQRKFKLAVDDTKEALGNALLPVMTNVTSYMQTNLTPILERLQAKLGDGTSVQNFINFIGSLLKNLFDFGRAIATVFAPVFTGVLVPAIKLAVGAVIAFIQTLGAIGRFIQRNAAFFQVLVGAVTAVGVAIGAYLVQVALYNAYSKVMLAMTAAKTLATTKLSKAFKALNLIMRMNPIGLVVAAVALLATGFMMLWNKSDAFRKMVITIGKVGLKVIGFVIKVVGVLAEAFVNLITGPMKLFLKILGFINPDAKKAYDGLSNMTKGVGKFFDDAAAKVEGFAKNLDGLAKKKVSGPKEDKMAPIMPDLAALGKSNRPGAVDAKAQKAAEAAAKKLAEMQQNLKEAVNNYSDFMKFEFSDSFMKGADAARSSVMGALDKLAAVFEAKGKMLSGPALAKLRAAFDKVNADVRVMMEEYAKVAGQIEDIQQKISEANSALEKAIEERASAMKRFGELLRTPFGEPSEIDRAMRDGEATVDSIIGMYDNLVEAVNQRFTGMSQGAKSLIVDYLTDQTAALVKLAKRRTLAVDALKQAEDDLAQVLESQANFQQKLTGGIKDFAKALVTLSNADTKAVLTVTKTASGLVISQVKKATTGVDSITKQLTERLTQIVSFGKNIQSLLAAGLNKEYIQQLLEAGPGAASETAALLATASADQIAQINSLYSQINTQAESFGTQMSNTFYGNSVAMAQAFVAGAQAEVVNINAQMTKIVDGIKIIMGVLGNTGLTSAQALIDALIVGFGEVNQKLVGTAALGVTKSVDTALSSLRTLGTSLATDLAQGLYDKLKTEETRLVELAKSIAAQIAAAMSAAMASIGVSVDTGVSTNTGPFESGPLVDDGGIKKTDTVKKDIKDTIKSKIPTELMPTFGNIYGPPSANYGKPAISAVKPAATPILTRAQATAGSNIPAYGRAMAGAAPQPVTVNINTNKVTPTVTPKTVAAAVANSTNSRRSR